MRHMAQNLTLIEFQLDFLLALPINIQLTFVLSDSRLVTCCDFNNAPKCKIIAK